MSPDASTLPAPALTVPISAYRWVVLGLFMLVAGLSQALWLNFAPLLTLVQAKYGVSESWASGLLLVFPLVYVLLSVPAGLLTDRKGYRFSVGFGAVLMAGFSVLRIHETNFGVLLLAQAGIAVGQPFAVNGISKLVADWFPKEHSAMATGLGTMGLFLGMAVGMAATPPMVEGLGSRGAMVAFSAVSLAVCAAFLLLSRTNPEAKPEEAVARAPSMGSLLRDRKLLLFVVAALGLGFFFLPAFALLLDMCGAVAGEAAAGSATGLLMLFGNGGGVLVILAMGLVKGDAPTFERAVYLLYGVVALGLVLALGAPETMSRRQERAAS